MVRQQRGPRRPAPEPLDGGLARRPLAGEPGAGEDFLLPAGTYAVRIIRRRSGRAGLRSQEAEDARDKAPEWVLEALRGYRPGRCRRTDGGGFRAWLATVVNRGMTKFVRDVRQTSRRAVPLSEAAGVPADPEAGPARAAERAELQDRVARALAALDDPARRVVELHVGGLSLRAVAEETGASYQATRWQWDRARRRLRAALAE
jgi:RNA polymerase sigma factor (sigma-70 family)